MEKLLAFTGAISVVLFLTGCQSTPKKPSFTPSTAFDGNYRGIRIDVSNDQICKETSIVGSVNGGEAKFTLSYNGTLLKGWVTQDGELHLYDNNPRWDYHFTGKASGKAIEGNWHVGNAPCRGTWSVNRI